MSEFWSPGKIAATNGAQRLRASRQNGYKVYVSVAGSKQCKIWVTLSSHRHMFQNDPENFRLCMVLKMERMKLPRTYVFCRQGNSNMLVVDEKGTTWLQYLSYPDPRTCIWRMRLCFCTVIRCCATLRTTAIFFWAVRFRSLCLIVWRRPTITCLGIRLFWRLRERMVISMATNNEQTIWNMRPLQRIEIEQVNICVHRFVYYVCHCGQIRSLNFILRFLFENLFFRFVWYFCANCG